MKKIISSLLALSLIVGSSFNSMSLSALADSSIKVQNVAETQAKSPQKTLPLSPEGQAALDTFYANQSYPKVDFISWNDWIPSGSELESIRIYRSESPFHGLTMMLKNVTSSMMRIQFKKSVKHYGTQMAVIQQVWSKSPDIILLNIPENIPLNYPMVNLICAGIFQKILKTS